MHEDYIMLRKKYPFKWYIKYPIEAFFAYTFYYGFKLLPMNVSSFITGKLARLCGPLSSTYKLALRNLALALPELSKSEHKKIARDAFENFGRMIGEFAHGKTLAKKYDKYITVEGLEYLEAFKQQNGGIVCSPHMGNWDTIGILLHKAGVTFGAIYRKANNPYVERLFVKARHDYARAVLFAKGLETAKPMLEYLLKGNSLAIMIDQKINEGIETDFFQHKAMTTPFPATVHLKYHKPLLCIHTIHKPGFRVRLHIKIEPAPVVHVTGDKTVDTLAIMNALNKQLEGWIRANPNQWLWMHNRWKK